MTRFWSKFEPYTSLPTTSKCTACNVTVASYKRDKDIPDSEHIPELSNTLVQALNCARASATRRQQVGQLSNILDKKIENQTFYVLGHVVEENIGL